MKRSIFLALLASLLVAFSSASAGKEIIDGLDDKVRNKIDDDVINDLEDDIDDCEDDEDTRTDFLNCVYASLDDFSDREIKSKDKRTIKKLARQYDFVPHTKKGGGPKKGPGGKRRLGQTVD
jgi:hypothetical protein